MALGRCTGEQQDELFIMASICPRPRDMYFIASSLRFYGEPASTAGWRIFAYRIMPRVKVGQGFRRAPISACC